MEVVGVDYDGMLFCVDENEVVYSCGESLAEFGVENLAEQERDNVRESLDAVISNRGHDADCPYRLQAGAECLCPVSLLCQSLVLLLLDNC